MAAPRLGFALAQDPESGGIFQYSEAIRDALCRLTEVGDIDPPILLHRAALGAIRDPTIGLSIPIEPPSVGRLVRRATRLLSSTTQRRLREAVAEVVDPCTNAAVDERLTRWLRRKGVRLLLLPSPDRLAFESGIPSIMAIHDLQHRLQPQFPEVSADYRFETREYLYRNAARHCDVLTVDSEVGKEDLLNLYAEYGATPDRIRVLPFIPPPYLRPVGSEEAEADLARFRLPDRFLFYPAKFWPHKNHVSIIEALSELPASHQVHVVFCGSNKGRYIAETFRSVVESAKRRGLEDRVHYLGYVSDDEMSALYTRASALVMPTFFGPTNIPVIEAWNFGLPVITSDVRGIREQVGDAGVLVDPGSSSELADAIRRVWNDDRLVQKLVAAGRAKLEEYTPTDFRERLRAIIEEAVERLDT